MPFRDAQDLVDGLGPFARNSFLFHNGAERFAQGIAKAQGQRKQALRRVRIGAGKRKKSGATLLRNNARGLKEKNQFLPGEMVSRSTGKGRHIGKIDRQAATKQESGRGKVGQGQTPQITG